MAIRKYGNEPAKVEIRAEDNDQKTLDIIKAQAAFEASPVVAEVGEFLDHPETGVVWDRNRRRS
jgi:hypothetical protein